MVTRKRELAGTIRVGAVDYMVYQVRGLRADGEDCLGTVRYGPSEMELDAGMGEQHRRVTAWHEVLHAIVRQAGHDDLPEPVVDALAYGIVEVLRDNRGNMLLGG